jgi:hypothetical protein
MAHSAGIKPTTRISVYLDTLEEIKKLSATSLLPYEMVLAIAVHSLQREALPGQIGRLLTEWAEKDGFQTNLSKPAQ